MGEKLIQAVVQKAQAPFNAPFFERRENNSINRMAMRDMPGVGAPAKTVLDIYSKVIDDDESGDWECGACGGSGEGSYDGSSCMACRGTGGSY